MILPVFALCADAADLDRKVRRSNVALDAALAPLHMAQIRSKQVRVVHFAGKGFHENMRCAYQRPFWPGNTQHVAKYLGCTLRHNGDLAVGNRSQIASCAARLVLNVFLLVLNTFQPQGGRSVL